MWLSDSATHDSERTQAFLIIISLWLGTSILIKDTNIDRDPKLFRCKLRLGLLNEETFDSTG